MLNSNTRSARKVCCMHVFGGNEFKFMLFGSCCGGKLRAWRVVSPCKRQSRCSFEQRKSTRVQILFLNSNHYFAGVNGGLPQQVVESLRSTRRGGTWHRSSSEHQESSTISIFFWSHITSMSSLWELWTPVCFFISLATILLWLSTE